MACLPELEFRREFTLCAVRVRSFVPLASQCMNRFKGARESS